MYLAEDIRLGRRVAVKRLRPALSQDEKFLNLFRTEAQVSAQLNHENILTVYDWGDHDGVYLISELLLGGTLQLILQKHGVLDPAQAIEVARQAAMGLRSAHSEDLVHRDIKPANLLFGSEGRLRIADFGVARAVAESAWTELTGTFVGTVKYAAPEQMKRRSGDAPIDSRADIYSLGLILSEMLTGEVPLLGEDAFDTISMRQTTGVESNLEGLAGLGELIDDCCALVPADRPTAEQVVERLELAGSEFEPAEPIPVVKIDLRSKSLPTMPAPVDSIEITQEIAVPESVLPEQVSEDVEKRAIKLSPVVLLALAGMVATAYAFWTSSQAETEELASAVELLPQAELVGDYVGLNLSEVRAAVTEAGWELEVDSVRNNEAEVGEVLSQSIATGEPLKDGETITITVSEGRELGSLPRVIGLEASSARQIIESAGLTVGATAAISSDDIPEGQVIAVFLDGEDISDSVEPLEQGSAIELRVSSGPSEAEVPNVYGYEPAEAREILEDAGFEVVVEEVFTAVLSSGLAIGSEPRGETTAEPGSTIKVLVSKGQQQITVPNVLGDTGAEAAAALTNLGFKVNQVGGNASNQVIEVNPAAGAKLSPGATVTIVTSTLG